MQDRENEGPEPDDDRAPVSPESIALVLADMDATARRFEHWVREQNRRAADRRAMSSPAIVLHGQRPAHPVLN